MDEEDVSREHNVAEDGFGEVDPFQRFEQQEDVGGYRHREYKEERPPFSPAELVIMAIICSSQAYIDRNTIYLWITETIPYYRLRARHPNVAMGGGSLGYLGFSEAFWQAEIPLIPKKVVDEDGKPRKGVDGVRWSTKPCQARMYLRRWLEPARKGVLRFLDLPAELRNRVYEELLVYPGPALDIDDDSGACRVSKRVCDVEGQRVRLRQKWYHAEAPAQTLGVLLACKQIYQEAMPVYYGLNAFRFSNQYKLCKILDRLSADRRRHIKNMELAVCWHRGGDDEYDDERMPEVGQAIARGVSLDKLRICHCDNCAWYYEPSGNIWAPADPSQVDYTWVVTELALQAKEVDAVFRRKSWAETSQDMGEALHDFILDQLQQAGSKVKVVRSVEEGED